MTITRCDVCGSDNGIFKLLIGLDNSVPLWYHGGMERALDIVRQMLIAFSGGVVIFGIMILWTIRKA